MGSGIQSDMEIMPLFSENNEEGMRREEFREEDFQSKEESEN